jgi:hypothetical protein
MKKAKQKSWTQKVMETSFALDLEPGVFTFDNPRRIAQSLKESAERCSKTRISQEKRSEIRKSNYPRNVVNGDTQRKTGPFQSAMSMLNYYINRAGTKLPSAQKERLEQAKDELRELYGRKRRHHNLPLLKESLEEIKK